jgi:hypothetical protein
MKGVQRFGVKRKLTPRYVGPYPIIERCGRVAYKLQLPSEMRMIFPVFHVSQLKKCLRVPKEEVKVGDIKIKKTLTYVEEPISVLDRKDHVTRNRVVKFYKIMWSNHSKRDATWEWEDYLREVYPAFYQKWYAFQISGRDFYKGRAVTPHVFCLASMHHLSMIIAWHYHKHHHFMCIFE